MDQLPSTASYFRKSPFLSLSFDIVTAFLAVFVVAGVRAMDVQSSALKASAAIFGLVLLPVAVWTMSLLSHWEIRALVQQTDGVLPYPEIAKLHYSRLTRLHQGLTLGVTIMSWGIIQALMTATSIRQ